VRGVIFANVLLDKEIVDNPKNNVKTRVLMLRKDNKYF
jgi:hypothetical protein